MPASTSTRSGNPAKKAAAKKAPAKRVSSRSVAPTEPVPVAVSEIHEWKQSAGGELLTLPSGKVARIRRVPLPTLIAENLLGDSISVIASQHVDAAQGMKAEEIKALADDPTKVIEALDAFQKITVRCFMEPAVTYYKFPDEHERAGQVIPVAERNDHLLYSDEIDVQDQIYVFSVVSGGTADLQAFRAQFAESVAGVSAI